jgi:hypothetical protein
MEMKWKLSLVPGGTTDNIPCRRERQEPPRDIPKTIWFFGVVVPPASCRRFEVRRLDAALPLPVILSEAKDLSEHQSLNRSIRPQVGNQFLSHHPRLTSLMKMLAPG